MLQQGDWSRRVPVLLPPPAGRAGSSGSLECQLVCEALGLYPSATVELETDEEGWALCWACPLLFSDDAARCGWGCVRCGLLPCPHLAAPCTFTPIWRHLHPPLPAAALCAVSAAAGWCYSSLSPRAQQTHARGCTQERERKRVPMPAFRYAALEQLNSRRAELVAQRDELQGRLQHAQQVICSSAVPGGCDGHASAACMACRAAFHAPA